MSQSKLYSCLLIGEKITCISYVDDLLFQSKDEAHIHEFVILLCQTGVDLEQKDDVVGFLGKEQSEMSQVCQNETRRID